MNRLKEITQYMFQVNTIKMNNMIVQKITFFWIFSIGVSNLIYSGEHYGFFIEVGPMQFEFAVRYFNHEGYEDYE